MLYERDLSRIPTAPRAKIRRPVDGPVRIQVEKDRALMDMVKRVIAGIDKKYELFPGYEGYVREYGKEKFHKIVDDMVTKPAVDVIQTEMDHSGIGLFGALADDKQHFEFYEWISGDEGQLKTILTHQEIRDIYSGKKKIVEFVPNVTKKGK